MQCLLQVVKWLTKCLFYSWLLKICTGLSLLFSSFVHDMFCKCSYFHPCGLQLSPHASNTGSSGRCVCLEAKTGAHTTNSDAIFLSSNQHFAELTFHQRDEHKCIFTTGKYSARRQLHLSNRMLLVSVSTGKQAARSSRLCHASVMLLYHHV